VSSAATPRRPARSQESKGREVSTKVTDSPADSDVVVTAIESGCPAATFRRSASKSMFRRSSARRGELSRSARGIGSSQPPVSSAAKRCRPERNMSSPPARNTCPVRNPPQTRTSSKAAPRTSLPSAASTAALMAPADVPQRIGNGSGEPAEYQPAIAFRTPTW
jgi:hypothetical protein